MVYLPVVHKPRAVQKKPIVLILEDLHWATDSLEVIRRINRLTEQHPILVIGSFRNDEKPTLPNELPTMEVIQLERLRGDAIAALSASMLGEIGTQPEILQLLERETEGNIFFLVETVRALAEEAGGLDNIGKVTIPVAAGRNLAVLTEAAVRNHVLQLRGIDSTQQFIERQSAHIEKPDA